MAPIIQTQIASPGRLKTRHRRDKVVSFHVSMSAPKIAPRLSKTAKTPSTIVPERTRPQFMKKFAGNDFSERSRAKNIKFYNSIRYQVINSSPNEIANLLDLNFKAGKFQRNLDIAARIAEDPLKRRFLTPQIYIHLLESVAAQCDSSLVPLALNLTRELTLTDCSSEDIKKAANFLFKCFEVCSDFTQLLSLKIVYQNIIAKHSPSPHTALSYLACHIYVYINTGQISSAVDHFSACMQCLQTASEKTAFLRSLPLSKLVKTLCSSRDNDVLLTVLQEVVNCDYASGINLPDWAEVLGVALWLNDYALVKIIYENVIMREVDSLETDDSVAKIESSGENQFLASLSGSALHGILHCLAMNGDVSSCMGLLEWHFVHQANKGKDALTKEHYIQIVVAYCFYNPNASEIAKHGADDTSVKIVLQAVEAFVRKNDFPFDYIDMVDAFSHKLNTYRAFDANVARAVEKETTVPLPPAQPNTSSEIEDEVEEDILLKKKSNTSIQESASGGVLKNTSILSDFIADHISYISQNSYSDETRQIFVNCTLAHLAVYQNTTGVICAMRSMKETDPINFPSVLDASSYEILLKSFADSPAAMMTGYSFYCYMKDKNQPVSSRGLQNLVISSLRGNSYNSLLEFYVYEYLKSKPQQISNWLLRRIRSFKRLNEEGKALLRVLEKYQCSKDFSNLDELWDANNFTRANPVFVSTDEIYERFLKIDERDKRILELIFDS